MTDVRHPQRARGRRDGTRTLARARRWRSPPATTSTASPPIAEQLCLAGHGTRVSYSRKVFIPLTKLCRDVCHYCTFAHAPRKGEPAYLSPEEVLEIARAGKAAGCKEALFTLGDQPELRYAAAREALAELGADSTLDYLETSAALVLKETGPAAASQSRRHGRGLARAPAQGVGVAGHHAGDGVRPAVAARRPALRLARQGAGGAPRHAGGRRPRARALHHRHPDRHRRDAGRAHRGAARDPRHARAPRPHPGDHRPELPRQARHAHGRRRRALARGPGLDHRRGAPDPRAGHEHPGAAQPAAPRASRSSSAPASTTGAASRRSRPTTSTPRRPGRTSPTWSAPPSAPAAPWSSASPSIRSLSRPGSTRRLPAASERGAERHGKLDDQQRVCPVADSASSCPTAFMARGCVDRPGAAHAAAAAPGCGGAGPRGWRGRRAGWRRCRGRRSHTCRRRKLTPTPAIARILDRVGAGEALDRGRHRRAVRCARRGLHRRVPGGRRAARAPRRRHRHLHRQPQHQLHQHLHLRLQVLRLLQGPPQPRPPRQALRSRPRGDRCPHDRGLGARRHRGVPAGRHQAQLHRQHLSRHRRGGEDGGARHPRARLLAAGDPHRRRYAGAAAPRVPLAPARTRASPACPARRPRSSTTRCARSCAPTRSTPPSGSR